MSGDSSNPPQDRKPVEWSYDDPESCARAMDAAMNDPEFVGEAMRVHRDFERPVPVESIIEVLESVHLRKAMYFSPVTPEAAETFLGGFTAACIAFGLPQAFVAVSDAILQRGWVSRCVGPIPDMRAKGLSDEAIIDELIAIHILALRRGSEKQTASQPQSGEIV